MSALEFRPARRISEHLSTDYDQASGSQLFSGRSYTLRQSPSEIIACRNTLSHGQSQRTWWLTFPAIGNSDVASIMQSCTVQTSSAVYDQPKLTLSTGFSIVRGNMFFNWKCLIMCRMKTCLIAWISKPCSSVMALCKNFPILSSLK